MVLIVLIEALPMLTLALAGHSRAQAAAQLLPRLSSLSLLARASQAASSIYSEYWGTVNTGIERSLQGHKTSSPYTHAEILSYRKMQDGNIKVVFPLSFQFFPYQSRFSAFDHFNFDSVDPRSWLDIQINEMSRQRPASCRATRRVRCMQRFTLYIDLLSRYQNHLGSLMQI